MDSSINPRTRLRYNILLIILATIPCYCLGMVVLQVKSMIQSRPTSTPSPTYFMQNKTKQYELPTKIASITSSPTISLTPSMTWTITVTKSPFQTPTPTYTGTPTETQTPTLTPTLTDTATFTNTSPPPTDTDTPVPPTETSTLTPEGSTSPNE